MAKKLNEKPKPLASSIPESAVVETHHTVLETKGRLSDAQMAHASAHKMAERQHGLNLQAFKLAVKLKGMDESKRTYFLDHFEWYVKCLKLDQYAQMEFAGMGVPLPDEETTKAALNEAFVLANLPNPPVPTVIQGKKRPTGAWEAGVAARRNNQPRPKAVRNSGVSNTWMAAGWEVLDARFMVALDGRKAGIAIMGVEEALNLHAVPEGVKTDDFRALFRNGVQMRKEGKAVDAHRETEKVRREAVELGWTEQFRMELVQAEIDTAQVDVAVAGHTVPDGMSPEAFKECFRDGVRLFREGKAPGETTRTVPAEVKAVLLGWAAEQDAANAAAQAPVHAEEPELSTEEMVALKGEGAAACAEGQTRSDCPHPAGSVKADAWLSGFDEAEDAPFDMAGPEGVATPGDEAMAVEADAGGPASEGPVEVEPVAAAEPETDADEPPAPVDDDMPPPPAEDEDDDSPLAASTIAAVAASNARAPVPAFAE